jgi:hypothetical protein
MSEYRRGSYLSPPQIHALDIACIPLHTFGMPYLVGSVNTRRDYRDVDVRLILDDTHPLFALGDECVKALNYTISRYLEEASGLPVDFQFQKYSEIPTGPEATTRNPLGTRWFKGGL